MTLQELGSELQHLVGETITYKRIAGNCIIVYFFGGPGDATVKLVDIEVPWRYEKHGKILLGSYDLSLHKEDFESIEEYRAAFERLCKIPSSLNGSRLESCAVDPVSSDLTLEFSDGQTLRNFSNSAYDDLAWSYRNCPQKMSAHASPSGVHLFFS